jgi:hypothetical protein
MILIVAIMVAILRECHRARERETKDECVKNSPLHFIHLLRIWDCVQLEAQVGAGAGWKWRV